MKIDYLKINGFGKIENKEIELSDNINVIYGKNEAGKSTILKFISGMLYGVSKNKNKKEYSDFERYKPWNKEEFSGKIKYTLDNNEKYEVYRDFSKKNPQIYNERGEDVSKNFSVNKTKGSEFFVEQTKIDEGTFLSTTMIMQNQVVLDESEQQVITQKMTNILSTGTENTSFKKAIDKLNKKQLDEVGTERSSGRPINIINENIRELKKQKEELEIDENKKDELDANITNAEKNIDKINVQISLMKDIKAQKEEARVEEEKLKINENIINEQKDKIEELERKREHKTKIKKQNKTPIYVLLVLTIINIILAILNINKLFIFTLIGLIVADVAIIVTSNIKTKKERNSQREYKNKIASEIELLEDSIKNTEGKMKRIEEEINDKNATAIMELTNKYENDIDKEDIRTLFMLSLSDLNHELTDMENSVSNAQLKLHTDKINYEHIEEKENTKAKLEEKLQGYLQDKEELMGLSKSIELAKKSLENAYEKMKSEVTPKFTEDLSLIIKNISEGKYKNVKYTDEDGIVVELENGEYVKANKLSIGTIDQLYLSLRLATIKELSDENMPIILDESFAYYDDERLANILKYLHTNYKNNQIIIFTCSNREKEILEKNGMKYEYINIE